LPNMRSIIKKLHKALWVFYNNHIHNDAHPNKNIHDAAERARAKLASTQLLIEETTVS
jgi:hypothetical protein